jgi:hypothetical protein
VSCDIPTSLSLLAPDTLAAYVELQDDVNGLSLVDALDIPNEEPRQGRRKSSRVRGSYSLGPAIDDDGSYVARLVVEGGSWSECKSRFVSVRTSLRSRSEFYLQEELDGVRTRWYSDAPVSILPAPVTTADRMGFRQEYELRFLVQPNPSVTIL